MRTQSAPSNRALVALAAAVAGWFGHRAYVWMRASPSSTDESRTHLVRGITHDLKNPLGAADGYAELLQLGVEGELSPAQLQMVEGMRRSIATALGLVEDLLEMSGTASAGVELNCEMLDCRELIQEAVTQYRGAIDASGLDLTVLGAEGTLLAIADRDRVLEIAGNLLSNAVKYTPAPGRIVISLGSTESPLDGGAGRWVELCFTDSGPGIPPEERERIFDEFHRVHGDRADGHGLGLASSRRLARLLGGDLTVESTDGEGSAFSLWLPLADG